MLRFFRNFWHISDFFWKSKYGKIALAIVVLLLVLEGLGVALSVYLNSWNVGFYNSIQEYNKALLIHQLIIFTVLISLMMFNFFLSYLVKQFFVIFIRKPMTDFYTKNWLYSRSYYRSKQVDNPEERIDEDVTRFITDSQSLFLGITRSIFSFFSFAVVLWGLSGDYTFNILGVDITIYGYLFWVAFLLGLLNIVVVFWVGRPLKKLVYQKQKLQANFRYHLSTIRNNRLSVRDYNAERYEYARSRRNFKAIVTNFYSLMFRNAKIDVVNTLFSQVYAIIGTILSLPRYFAKQISFGQMMQVNSAVMQVIFPMVYLTYVYETLASLRASMSRLTELKHEISSEKAKADEIDMLNCEESILEVNSFSLQKSQNSPFLLDNICFRLKSQERLLISGHSGIGKSTLLRAIAGVGCGSHEGDIIFAKKCLKICLLPQKPYYPEDDFKRAIFYPIQSGIPSDDKFIEILELLNVGYLAKYINTINDWRNFLSSGEQQKLNFCRIFVKEYDLLLLDEATSNIDINSERKIYQILQEKGFTYISTSHSERVREYHDSFLDFSND
ncbi:ABC transporter ATP-binding protein/permease [Francisella sciaenopsi]|uniref:ABC transporter ATP-binding protein/permease n=1 Tax=Francisella sciaenopsi TaxID=3055034 RepID=A0ABQ6PE55_9GAMM